MTSTTETYALIRLLDTYVAKAARVSEVAQIARIETMMRQFMTREWYRLARRAVRSAIARIGSGGAITARDVVGVMRSIDAQMSAWAKRVGPRMAEDVEDIYELARLASWRKATGRSSGSLQYDTLPFRRSRIGVKVQKARPKSFLEAVPAFGVEDQEAIRAMKRDIMFWTGRHYEENVREALRSKVEETILRQGLDRAEAGRLLGAALREQLGEVHVPTGFNGSAKQYFEGLAANTATVARVGGTLKSFAKAGITRYEITNPIDERTCPTCSHMDGKVFTVREGEDLFNRTVNAKSPEAVRQIHPWIGTARMKAISPKPGPQGSKDASALHSAGFSLPPFHFRCRCGLDMSIEEITIAGPEIAEPSPIAPPPPAALPQISTPAAAPERAFPFPFERPAEYAGQVSAPAKPFDIDNFSKALANVGSARTGAGKRAQAAIRKELNELLAEHGMISADLRFSERISRGGFAVPKKDIGFNGTHAWDGKIEINRPVQARGVSAAKRLAAGEKPTVYEMGGLRTMVHEAVHGHSPITHQVYVRSGRWIEEATTELAARKVIREKFGFTMAEIDSIGSYQKVIDRVLDSVEEAITRATGARPARSVVREIVDGASIKMRQAPKKIENVLEFLEHTAGSMEFPAAVVADKTPREIGMMRARIVEFFDRNLSTWDGR